jgi:translation initiation factor RLI1
MSQKVHEKIEKRQSTQAPEKKKKLTIKEITPEELSKVSGGGLACASWQGCCIKNRDI